MTARRIIVPEAMPARDANGRGFTARLHFFEPGAAYDTTKPVYTSSALNVAHQQPITSVANGRFPPIWADSAEEFDAILYRADTGAQVKAYQDIQPAVDAQTNAQTQAEAAADAAEAAQAASEAVLAELAPLADAVSDASASASAAAASASAASDDATDAEAARVAAEAAADAASGSASAADASADAAAASAVAADASADAAAVSEAAAAAVLAGAVRADVAQSFTSPQKGQARANIGAVIGTDVQGYSATLATLASSTAAGLALMDDADAAAQRTTLGLGTIATQAANNVAITGGSVTGITDITVADGGTGASTASAARTNLGLAIGTDILGIGGGTLTGALTLAADPASALQAATKQYVDNLAAGLDVKASVRAATTANITLSGAQTIDGVSVIAGDRVLVKDQSTASQNGIYVAAAGSWTRATDMDAWAEVPGANCWVEEGTANADRSWVCTSNAGGTIGSTAITWTQFGGTGAFQAASANLSTWSAIAPSASAQAMASAADYSAMRTLLGLVIGTNVQAYDADLTTWAGLTPSANAQSLVTAADYSAMRTLLSLVPGTNVQAYSSILAGFVSDQYNNVKPTETIMVAIGDETTAITTGTAKVTFRMPYAFTVTAVRASLTTVSSSGTPTFDINEAGSSILSTKLTIDASEKTSTTAATPAVISDASLADDAEMTIDIDTAGTGAAGAKIYIIGHRT